MVQSDAHLEGWTTGELIVQLGKDHSRPGHLNRG